MGLCQTWRRKLHKRSMTDLIVAPGPTGENRHTNGPNFGLQGPCRSEFVPAGLWPLHAGKYFSADSCQHAPGRRVERSSQQTEVPRARKKRARSPGPDISQTGMSSCLPGSSLCTQVKALSAESCQHAPGRSIERGSKQKAEIQVSWGRHKADMLMM